MISLVFPGAGLSAAEATNKVAGGQSIVITSTNGAILDLEANKTIYYGNVRVIDRDMELMCEQLTINFQTNSGTRQLERIVAETNVVIAQKDSWAFGDKAVYTITNDLFELSATTGEVLLDHPDFYLIGATVIYDRKTGKFHAPGAVTVGGTAQGGFGTNALGLGLPVRDARPTPPLVPVPNTAVPQGQNR
jgi:lipopolysaccharide export system protein LptA